MAFLRLTEGKQIIIGSSMGGWLGLLLAQAQPQRVKAFIGVAAAPDFTENLVWAKLTKIQREKLLRDGEIYDDNAPPDHRIPMTLWLIEEAREHLILDKPFALGCPVRLLQGMNPAYPVCCQSDESVIICRNGLPCISNNTSGFSAGLPR